MLLPRTAVAAFAVLLLAPGLRAASEPAQEKTPDELTLINLLGQYKPNRDLRPETSLFEPSKVLLLPHVAQGGKSATGRQDRLAIEVEFNETFFPYQNPPSATDRHFGGGIHKLGITPMYRVRIWKENSAPVRVPSFMPKGTLQWEYLNPRERGLQWGEKKSASGKVVRKAIRLHSASITVGHHSNGQDGCLFADASGVGYPRDACPPHPSSIYINRLDGSFSTNYAEASYYFRRLSLKPDARDLTVKVPGLWDKEQRATHSWLLGATYQWNVPFDSFGGPVERAVRPIYGMNRLRVTAGYEKYWVESLPPETKRIDKLLRPFRKGGFKARGWVEISDKSEDAADCVVSGSKTGQPVCAPQLGWGVDLTIGLFSKADGLGLYSRFLQVQDYYNLSFTRRKDNRFQTGLSFSLSRARGQAFPIIHTDILTAERTTNKEWAQYRKDIKRGIKEAIKECFKECEKKPKDACECRQ